MVPAPKGRAPADIHSRQGSGPAGHRYPGIKINTIYSFGLDDPEFVVAFEGDKPEEFLDLVMEMREHEVRKYTLRDTPIFTCIRGSVGDVLATLG